MDEQPSPETSTDGINDVEDDQIIYEDFEEMEELEELEEEFEFSDENEKEIEKEIKISISDSSSEFEQFTPKRYMALSPTDSYLFTKPFDIRCLGEVQLSQSSQCFNPYFRFPETTLDFDLEEHLWEPPKPLLLHDNIVRYKHLVKKYNAETVKDIIDQLESSTMNLKYYGLSMRSYKILFEVLIHNNTITRLDLTNNVLDSVDVAEVLADMIHKNHTLEELNLSFCYIGPQIMGIICKYLKHNHTLKVLNLSHCNIEDAGCKKLAEAIGENTGIEELDISHNNLTVDCCEELGDCLFDNTNLIQINFSENSFGAARGLKFLVNNLRDNFSQSITHLNMTACNIGLDNDRNTRILLSKITGLTHLDLSKNVYTGSLVDSLIKGLHKNESLIVLSLAYNPLTSEDITKLVEYLNEMKPKQPLKELNLTDKYIPKALQPIVEHLKKKGRNIIFREYLCNYTLHGPDMKMLYLNRMKAMCEKKSKKKKAKVKLFGSFFYNVTEDFCKMKQFTKFLQENCGCDKLIKDYDFIKAMALEFTDETKRVNIGLMRDLYLQAYPETPRPKPPKIIEEPPPPPVVEPPPPAKKKKADKKSAKKK